MTQQRGLYTPPHDLSDSGGFRWTQIPDFVSVTWAKFTCPVRRESTGFRRNLQNPTRQSPVDLSSRVQWIPAESSGFRRSPADSGGVRRIPADSGGVRRIPADSGGVLRSPVDSSRFWWSPAESSGFQRIPAESSRFQQIPAESMTSLFNY